MQKRRLSALEITYISFGFLGIQMGFALQNANASRILQSFGADVHQLSWFWLIAPIMGLIVQPLVGHYSDNTWNRFGRRKPYFLVGAILASIGLVLLPQADLFIAFLPALWVGTGMLMIMDASFNISMEPFRAFVADILNEEQRTVGFTTQTVLIGVGAVVGSWLPYVLTEYFGVANRADEGAVPLNLILSFIIGAAVLIVTILVTVVTTKEYSPEELDKIEKAKAQKLDEITEVKPKDKAKLTDIFVDFVKMPTTMKQLSWVQFFSWFALFGMWVFSTPAIAQHFYNLPHTDSSSEAFNNAGDWVGILFGIYNLVSIPVALSLGKISKYIGRKSTHMYALIIGGISFMSIYIMPDRYWLILPMIGIGIAWASILSMPYAILAGAINPKKMGVYMGIFNFFIVLPQILNGIIGGPMVKYFYSNQAIFALVLSGASMIIAALLVTRVKDVDDVKST
ncbi:MFS transporter [Mesohalobacter halotolerans]|uniref:SLC45 family MFS transporter n=1 Tax=Mesohalobacter halotolerans TaxID=1883405 RepID=A0A4V6XYA3_9FLAO|nr:MFS transporter [Mesohalobacter halotolerans]MBS3738296.1 MFS transporter [Psychroflexus sp.]TKS55935.1 SLC45 family MFS transporter [Mesohalobacter halotolerans]